MNNSECPAIKRASEMMKIPMGQLPWLAVEFAKYTIKKFGMCGEVLLTCWAVYAQEVEKLKCTDNLYKSSQEDAEWFRNARLQ